MNPVVYRIKSVFHDSEEIAQMLFEEDGELCKEAATHIHGLWGAALSACEEIEKLLRYIEELEAERT